jgi:hypothetical protein
MKKVVMIMLMVVMFIAGGLIFAECSADVEPEAVAIEAEAPEAEPEIEPEAEPETVTEEAEPEAPEAVETEPETPEQIIEAQTGLQVDYIKRIEGNSTWCAWYIEADGDIYVVTIKSGNVDKCVILN